LVDFLSLSSCAVWSNEEDLNLFIGEGEITFEANWDYVPAAKFALEDLPDFEFRVSSETDLFFN